MNKILSIACVSIFFFSLCSEADAVRLGGRHTYRPSRPATVHKAPTYRPGANAVRRFNSRQAASPGTVPVPLFIPPIIGTQNLVKVGEGFFLIKTGIKKESTDVLFWALHNHSYLKDSKSAKLRFRLNCATKQYSPIAIAAYSELDGKGTKMTTSTMEPKFRDIPPKTAMEALYNGMCSEGKPK